MEAFRYHDGELWVEQLPLRSLAETYGTPLYVYSRTHLQEQYRQLQTAFAEMDPLIFFAVKSNSNAAVIATLAELGAGADVVSGGELFRARRAGIPGNRIAFAGVGKSREEIEYALREDIQYFTVESEPELERISACAQRMGVRGRIALRVNPDVDPKTHKYTSTGKKENKFGVDLERARKAYDLAASLPGIDIAGLHMHLGSPLMSTDPYVEALEKVTPLCLELKKRFEQFRHIDIGGGLGINYSSDQHAPLPAQWAKAVLPYLRNLDLSLGMEPGRFLTGNAGVLLTRVEYVKESPFKHFLIVDAAMNDLIRPSLYEAFHEIRPLREQSETVFGDVVGPVCESGDFLAVNRDLPRSESGDLLAVMSAGAYGMVMASNYNSRGMPAEIMVQGDRHEQIRERETMEDLVRLERIPEWDD